MEVDRIAEELESLAPEQTLEAVLAANQNTHVCLTSSFQAEDMVVAHLLRKRMPDFPVLFLDTGYHFPQTYEYRDRMTREWSLIWSTCCPRKRSRNRNQRSAFCIAASPRGAANCARLNRSCARLNRLTSGSQDCGENNRPRGRISRRLKNTASRARKNF